MSAAPTIEPTMYIQTGKSPPSALPLLEPEETTEATEPFSEGQ